MPYHLFSQTLVVKAALPAANKTAASAQRGKLAHARPQAYMTIFG